MESSLYWSSNNWPSLTGQFVTEWVGYIYRNTQYDVKLDWKGSSAGTQIFTGEIDKNQPLEVVLSNLKLTSGMNSRLEKGVLTFY